MVAFDFDGTEESSISFFCWVRTEGFCYDASKISSSDGTFFMRMSRHAKRISLAILISADVKNFILFMRTSGSKNSLRWRILSQEDPVVFPPPPLL